MTKKEVEVQTALGTIKPQELTLEEFEHWIYLDSQKTVHDMKTNEEKRLRNENRGGDDSKH